MLKVALIGIDSSHTVEYARRMADPEFDAGQRVFSLIPASCLVFESPFQNAEGVRARSELLAGLGVRITRNFDDAVKGADAIMIECNDPADHLFHVEKCSKLGLPVFLDKPLADNYSNGLKIADVVRASSIRFFSSSPLRFASEVAGLAGTGAAQRCEVYGALGTAARGSSVVWYGVHAFEILETLMGAGAARLRAVRGLNGVNCVIDYKDGRSASVELRLNQYSYGGRVNKREFTVNAPNAEFYGNTLKQVEKFFAGGAPPVKLEDTLEVMALLDAVEQSLNNHETAVEVGK